MAGHARQSRLLTFPIATTIPALLDSLLVDADRIALVDDAQTLSALCVEIATRHLKLASIQSILVSAQPLSPATVADRNLTVEEAAKRLGVTTQWLYRHSSTLPFAKKISHRQLRFSERGIERWQKMKSAA